MAPRLPRVVLYAGSRTVSEEEGWGEDEGEEEEEEKEEE